MQTDLEYRKRRHELQRLMCRRWIEKNRARHSEVTRIYRAKGPRLGPMGALWATWLRRHAWVRDELDWRTHLPAYRDVRVERNCERCNLPPSHGARLWWVRTQMKLASGWNDLILVWVVSEHRNCLVALGECCLLCPVHPLKVWIVVSNRLTHWEGQ
jgi:hypothetical protein